MLSVMITQYAELAIFLLSCWGLGRIFLQRMWLVGDLVQQPGLRSAVATALGIGMFATLLQWLAIAGLLNAKAVIALLGIGLVRTGAAIFLWRSKPGPKSAEGTSWTTEQRLAMVVLAAAALPTLFAPLGPPIAWDELMYHLPHARQWALSGQLSVNEWLRYPWFPYNYDLLFSAALLFDNEVLPHLLHACAGWVTAWILYEIGSRELDRTAGCLAAALWIYLSRKEYGGAYIDMGVTLWLTAGAVALWQAWNADKDNSRGWWIVAGFLFGAATGGKYQALSIVPFFVIALLWREPRKTVWVAVAFAFLAPCAYWYFRNAALAGDPIAPLGGPIFGFTDWNMGDLRDQFKDFRRNQGLPHELLWSAPLVFLAPAARRHRFLVAVGALSAYQVAIWVVTSRYPRYLLPAYPLLALLAVQGWRAIGQKLMTFISDEKWTRTRLRACKFIVVLALCTMSLKSAYQKASQIPLSESDRVTLLKKKLSGYAVCLYLKEHPVRKLYQLGLEDMIYYLPNPVWGEVFGPWRYSDYASLEPHLLRKKLVDEGFDTLLVNLTGYKNMVSSQAFKNNFRPLFDDGKVALYRIQED